MTKIGIEINILVNKCVINNAFKKNINFILL